MSNVVSMQLARLRSARTGAIPNCAPGRVCPTTDQRVLQGPGGSCRTQMVLGLTTLAVAVAPGTATITLIARVAMKVERFIVITSQTPGFRIDAFSINSEPQFVLGSVVHSGIFAPDAVGAGLKTTTFGPGTTIELVVANLDAANVQDFYGHLLGAAVA